MLFDRICRENGIAHRLTQPASPTTTGKVERFHQTLRRELLDDCGAFESIEAAQAALDEWVEEYTSPRPHQALDMQSPAERFTPVPEQERDVLGVRVPGVISLVPQQRTAPVPLPPAPASPPEVVPAAVPAGGVPVELPSPLPAGDAAAFQVDRVVNNSGLVGLGGHQVLAAEILGGRPVGIRIDDSTLSFFDPSSQELLRVRPNPLSSGEVRRLRGLRSAGPPPRLGVEPVRVQRRISSQGTIMVCRQVVSLGRSYAGRTVTVHVAGTTLTVELDGQDRVIQRTTDFPVRNVKANKSRESLRCCLGPPSSITWDQNVGHRLGLDTARAAPGASRLVKIPAQRRSFAARTSVGTVWMIMKGCRLPRDDCGTILVRSVRGAVTPCVRGCRLPRSRCGPASDVPVLFAMWPDASPISLGAMSRASRATAPSSAWQGKVDLARKTSPRILRSHPQKRGDSRTVPDRHRDHTGWSGAYASSTPAPLECP